MFARLLAAFLALFAKKPTVADPLPTYTPTPEPIRKPVSKGAAIGGVAGASVLAAIVAFVAPWEGVRTKAYLDIAGVPTICYGHTKGVRMGDTATLEQCDAWLAEEVEEFSRGVRQCVTREITHNQEVSFVAISYNIGIHAFCNSTAVKRFNSGDDDGACDALQMWNRAGGGVVKGLVNRRAAESALCKKKEQP